MQCYRIRHGHKKVAKWWVSSDPVNNFTGAETKLTAMGHLALENRQLHDGLEQCTIDTVEEGNSQGGQTNTKLRVTSERTASPLETQSSRDSFTSPRTKA